MCIFIFKKELVYVCLEDNWSHADSSTQQVFFAVKKCDNCSEAMNSNIQ